MPCLLLSAVQPKRLFQVLLVHGAKVYIAARNQVQSEDTIRQLKEETDNEAIYLKLDLANLKIVKAAAEEFLRSVPSVRPRVVTSIDDTPNHSKENQLHVLFNNACVDI